MSDRAPLVDLGLGRGRPARLGRRGGVVGGFDLADIQGNILRGYTFPTAAYMFLRIDDLERARALLTGMLSQVTTATLWKDGGPHTAMQVAFTYAGLKAIGLPPEVLASFPEEFRQGMAARADRLGDRGPSAPAHWEAGLGGDETHVLVTVYAKDNERLDERRELLRKVGADAGATTVIHETRAEALPGGRDHFGFFDGIAQPAVAGSGVAPRPGDGLPARRGKWRDVATGEFLLGHLDEDGGMPVAPVAPLHRNGTFMVYRKLAMDVARFRSYMEEAGAEYPGGAEKLAAKVVGRWRDGTPVSLSPDRPDPEITGDAARINDFTFADDEEGLRCPLGAHIRRANPRDAKGFFGGRMTNRHRIIRRGRTYGPPLPPGVLEDDGQERGLVFVCFNTSIERQFETIQGLWVDDGDPFGQGNDKDFLIGEPDGDRGKMTIQGSPPHFLTRQPRFVTLRGGEYLFRPSISGLRWLTEAAGSASPPPPQ